jgi:flagellar biosynthesis protein FliR
MIDVFNQSPAQFETFLLVLVRCTVILSLVPVFSANQIPTIARIGLGLIVSFVVYRTVPTIAPLSSLYDLVAAILSQATIALIFGFVAYLVFMGVQFAGEILDTQIGFGAVNVINPLLGTPVSIVGQFELSLATLLFLVSDSHLLLLEGLGGSFSLLPLPFASLAPVVGSDLVRFLTDALMIVFKIAAPVAVALFITNVALGLMARVAPQMNVFVVGLPLQIGIGLVMLAVSLPLLGYVLPQLFSDIPHQLDAVMRGLIPTVAHP